MKLTDEQKEIIRLDKMVRYTSIYNKTRDDYNRGIFNYTHGDPFLVKNDYDYPIGNERTLEEISDSLNTIRSTINEGEEFHKYTIRAECDCDLDNYHRGENYIVIDYTTYSLRDESYIEKMADRDVRIFVRDFEWETKHQSTGRNTLYRLNYLKSLGINIEE